MSRTLSAREKSLATVVGLIVVLGGTWLLADSYLSARATLRAKIASDERQVRNMRDLLAQKDVWEQRDQWLQAKQPKLENPDTAGVQLLDYVQGIAKQHVVLLQNQVIHSPETRPNCVSVALEIETKCPWSALVAFLEDLQTPEQFIALESANLKVDPTDATQVHGRFKIARWYAAN
ncbi:MAG TPA: hypothetical protein VGM54_01810 [Chthoniobacter sp.]|jgi:hypothetical protein